MRGAAPPLRFLGVVLGGWACARAAMLAPAINAATMPPVIPRNILIPHLYSAVR